MRYQTIQTLNGSDEKKGAGEIMIFDCVHRWLAKNFGVVGLVTWTVEAFIWFMIVMGIIGAIIK